MTTTKAAKAVFSGNAASPTCVEQGGGNKIERKRQKKETHLLKKAMERVWRTVSRHTLGQTCVVKNPFFYFLYR